MERRPILVIDDDPLFCELVTARLMDSAFDVLSATDGQSGIELARKEQPAVILLDMVMPGIDGISVCKRLKQDPALRDIPVVGITSSDDLTFTGRAFQAGVDLFLPKPFQAAELLKVVELALASAERGTGPQGRRRRPDASSGGRARCSGNAKAKRVR